MPLTLIKPAGWGEIFTLRSKGKTQSHDASFCPETLSRGFPVEMWGEYQSGTKPDSRTGIFCDSGWRGNK